jgi:hypothetical protein
MTTPVKFTEYLGSASIYSVAALSSGRFVVAYNKGGYWEGRLRIGNIQSDTVVTFGDPYTFTSDMSLNGVEVTKLSDKRFLLTFSTNYGTSIQAGEVLEENHIGMGPSFLLKDDDYNIYSQIALSDTTFLIAYYDSDSDYGKCAFGRIDEFLELSLDSIYSFTGESISNSTYISIDTLSKSKFVIAYGYWDGKAIIGSIDNNDKITFGSSYNFTLNESYFINVVGLDENRFVVVYTDDYWTMKGAAVLGNISGNDQITCSGKFFFNNTETRGVSATKLTSGNIIIAFNTTGDEGKGYLVKTEIVDNTVNFSERVIHNDYVINCANPLSSLDDPRFIVLYLDAEYYYGYLRICRIAETAGPASSENDLLRNYSIYPNPSNGHLYIQTPGKDENIDVRLFDLNGRIVHDFKYSSDRISIQTNSFQKGTYVIQVINGSTILTEKIILE